MSSQACTRSCVFWESQPPAVSSPVNGNLFRHPSRLRHTFMVNQRGVCSKEPPRPLVKSIPTQGMSRSLSGLAGKAHQGPGHMCRRVVTANPKSPHCGGLGVTVTPVRQIAGRVETERIRSLTWAWKSCGTHPAFALDSSQPLAQP